HTEETDPQLKALADATVNLMFGAIEPIGDLVTTLPAGPEYPGRTAGPSFELFYESDYVLPHREAAWVLLVERLRQAADFCEPGAHPRPQPRSPTSPSGISPSLPPPCAHASRPAPRPACSRRPPPSRTWPSTRPRPASARSALC